MSVLIPAPPSTSDENERILSSEPSRLSAALRTAYAPLLALSTSALVAAAAWGLAWMAVAGLGVAVAIEWAAVYARPALAETLAKAGFRHRTRALLRSLIAAVALGVAADGRAAPLILYGLTATCAHVTGTACNTMIGWVLARAPAFGVRNVGADLDLPRRFALAKLNRPAFFYVVFAIEWLVLLGLSISVHGSEAIQLAITAAGLCAVGVWGALMAFWAQGLIRGGVIPDYEDRLLEELHEIDPEVIVYVSAAAGQSEYIVNQWLPAFAHMSRRGMIVVREESNLAPIGHTTLPLLHAPTTRDVERLVLPGVKLAIYVANAPRNVHLLREPTIKHVFLNHGDSDKATSANPVSRVYDEVWVAGQAGIDRYEAAGVHIPADRFAMIGRPQIEGLPVGPRPAGSSRRVLYAPTWEGVYEDINYSSLEIAGELIIRTILQERPDIAVIFKPHPDTGRWRPQMLAAQQTVQRLLAQSPQRDRHLVVGAGQTPSLNDCFAMSDVLISDVSSVVTDFLHTERPVITSNPFGLEHDEFRAMFPTQQASYVLGPDFGAVVEILDEALGDDALAEGRQAMKRYVLGDLPEGPLHEFDRNVDRVCDVAVRHATRVRNSLMLPASSIAGRRSGQPSLRSGFGLRS